MDFFIANHSEFTFSSPGVCSGSTLSTLGLCVAEYS